MYEHNTSVKMGILWVYQDTVLGKASSLYTDACLDLESTLSRVIVQANTGLAQQIVDTVFVK